MEEWEWRKWLLFLLFSSSLSQSSDETARVLPLFTSSTPIQNILVENGKVFIGSVNSLSTLLLPTLSPLISVSTGPVNDSAYCTFDGSSCLRGHSRRPTNNYNKVLLVVFVAGSRLLLECGSVRQGVCNFRSLSTLAVTDTSSTPVAANSATASTIALSLPSGLVVVASAAGSGGTESPYGEVPTLAVRTLPSLNVLNSGDLGGDASVVVRAEFRPFFPLEFVDSFVHDGFVYVGVVQPSHARRLPPRAPLISRLARFCVGDTRFASYSEISLECRGEDNSVLNLLTALHLHGDRLLATFSSSTSSQAALCVYSMSHLRITYWYNLDRCRSGSDSIGLPHIGRDAKCFNRSSVPLEENSCEMGVGGSIEEVEMASLSLPARAAAITSLPSRNVAFISTVDGRLLKLKSRDGSQWNVYSSSSSHSQYLSEDHSAIRQLVVLPEDNLLLLQQEKSVRGVSLSDCSSFESCSACVAAPDPFCGWCTALAACTATCPSQHTLTCPQIARPPEPSSLPVATVANITIHVEQLPPPDGFEYLCVFDGVHETHAILSSASSVVCPSPAMPVIGSSLTVPLSLRSSTARSRSVIATLNFTFYDCSQYSTCSSCISSGWPCGWCGSSCRATTECKESSSSECVKISLSSELLLPSSRSSSLSFSVSHPRLLLSSPHACIIRVGGRRVRFRAEIDESSSVVTCHGIFVEGRSARSEHTLQLVRDDNDQLLDQVAVTVFNCPLLASDCSSCLALSPSLNCSWCAGGCSSSCHPSKALPDPDDICTSPTILGFWPSSAPLEGGTEVRVEGRDLGSAPSDVDGKIFVAGARCRLRHFNISTGFTCILEKGAGAGPIRVPLGRGVAESSSVFSFVSPSLSAVSPSFGPLSGGTTLRVDGSHLNAGSHATLLIGQLPCRIVQRNSSSLRCVTSPAHRLGSHSPFRLKIDNSETISSSFSFDYRHDPVVHDVQPRAAFRSGGRLLLFTGEHLDSVQSARVFLLSSAEEPHEIVSEQAECRILNSTALQCLSPALLVAPHSASNGVSQSSVLSMALGMSTDGLASVEGLGRRLSLAVVADPVLRPFPGIRQHVAGQPLILHGQHLAGPATEPNDYNIMIGSERCVVTLVDTEQLVCSAPTSSPLPSQAADQLPIVVVRIGRLRYELGLLEYTNGGGGLRSLLLAACSSLVFVIALLLLLLLCCRRSVKKRETDYRKIQIQMENLESNVRKECKGAFAELQTSVEAAASATEKRPGGFILPFEEYVWRLLWLDGSCSVRGGLSSSATLSNSTTQSAGVIELAALLSEPSFVAALLAAVDAECVPAEEKAHLATLIVAALLHDFDAFTQVVLAFLRKHITLTVQRGSSRLLFRQSDSLAEMLTAKWVAVALYDFVAVHAAAQLHDLHLAFKLQGERGPVDCVTGSARYTINDAMLLTENIDAQRLEVCVFSLEGVGPSPVALLSCDSLSQAKKKIVDVLYGHLPFSSRPSILHFNLEWHCPGTEAVSLRDELGEESEGVSSRLGKSSSSSAATRRLATLQQLQLVDGALLVMTPSSRAPSSADSGQSSWCSWESRVASSSTSTITPFHLSPPSNRHSRVSSSGPELIPEVFLTRLLTSKGAVRKYIGDFFSAVFSAPSRLQPPPLKELCDLLDDEANNHQIRDELLVHQWKANIFGLRFWVNLIQNPWIVVDVESSPAIQANMAVIAQTVMASFSSSEPSLHADSPSSRLLFAREISQLQPESLSLFRSLRSAPSPPSSWTSSGSLSSPRLPARSLALAELLSWLGSNASRVMSHLERARHSLDAQLRLARLLNASGAEEDDEDGEHIYATLN